MESRPKCKELKAKWPRGSQGGWLSLCHLPGATRVLFFRAGLDQLRLRPGQCPGATWKDARLGRQTESALNSSSATNQLRDLG